MTKFTSKEIQELYEEFKGLRGSKKVGEKYTYHIKNSKYIISVYDKTACFERGCIEKWIHVNIKGKLIWCQKCKVNGKFVSKRKWIKYLGDELFISLKHVRDNWVALKTINRKINSHLSPMHTLCRYRADEPFVNRKTKITEKDFDYFRSYFVDKDSLFEQKDLKNLDFERFEELWNDYQDYYFARNNPFRDHRHRYFDFNIGTAHLFCDYLLAQDH